MKFKLFAVLLILILVLPSFSQKGRIDTLRLADSKIKVNGSITYYGGTSQIGYLSMSMNLSRNGRPVSDVKIEINNDPNTYNNNPGSGWIGGSISPYKIKLGNKITISLVFKNKPKDLHLHKFTKRIVVAVLKVNKIIEWVFPTPNQLITLPRLSLFIPFRWDFTGSPVRTELFIKDKATNKKVYSKIINSESKRIPSRIFKPGKEFKMVFWATDPIDFFKMTRETAPGSQVKFYFCNSMLFKVKK